MKQGTKLRLQAGAESMLYNAGAALGSIAYIALSPIAAPMVAASRVHVCKNNAAKKNEELSGMKQFKIGTQIFFKSFYIVPRTLFSVAKESVKESHDSRVAVYKLEHEQKLSEHIQRLESTGVADLLKLISKNDVECYDVKFVKKNGDVFVAPCWCFDKFVVYTDQKNKRCGVFEQNLYGKAIDADVYLDVPSELFDRVYDALTSRVAYQERMARLELEEESRRNRNRIAAERMAYQREIQQSFKNSLANSVSQLQK